MPPPREARTVACPACGRNALFGPANPWRPFCSERCRTSDLGGWADERFRIPAEPADGGGEDDANDSQKP